MRQNLRQNRKMKTDNTKYIMILKRTHATTEIE